MKHKWNFFCIVKGCGRVRNGISKYCAYHQSKPTYIKSEGGLRKFCHGDYKKADTKEANQRGGQTLSTKGN